MTNKKGATRIAIMAGAVAMAAMALSGCATVKGAGRDITSAGQAGENAIHGK